MTTRDDSTQVEDLTIEGLFEAAEAEAEGLATDADADPDSPAGEAEVEADSEETPNEVEVDDIEQADGEVDEFDFDDVADVGEDDDSAPVLDLATTVEVKGHGEVSIEELRNGYMMQADYTRSKQALADEKTQFATEQEAAAKILESLQEDPVGMAAYLAVETGLLTADQVSDQRIADLRGTVKVPKVEEIQAEIDKKVEAAVAADPRVQEAQASAVRAAIDSEFKQIESSVGKPLSEKAKIQIIKYANEHDLVDLGVAFDALSASTARKAAKREKLRQTATERPKTRGGKVTETAPTVETFEDAFELALAQHDEA